MCNTKLKIKKNSYCTSAHSITINKFIFIAKRIKSCYATNAYCPMATTIRRLKRSLRKRSHSMRMICWKIFKFYKRPNRIAKIPYKIYYNLKLYILIKLFLAFLTLKNYFCSHSCKINRRHLRFDKSLERQQTFRSTFR